MFQVDQMSSIVARICKSSRFGHPLTEACTRMAAKSVWWYCPFVATLCVGDSNGPGHGPGRCRDSDEGHAIRDAGQNLRLLLRGWRRLYLHEPAQVTARQIIPFGGNGSTTRAEISLFLYDSGPLERGEVHAAAMGLVTWTRHCRALL